VRTSSPVRALLLTFFLPAILFAEVPEWTGDVSGAAEKELSVFVRFPRIARIAAGVKGGAPRSITFSVLVPDDAPDDVKAMVYMKGKDGLWYQTTTAGPFERGSWEPVEFSLETGGGGVAPDGHHFQWNGYTATRMEILGVKFFSTAEYAGTIKLRNIQTAAAPLPGGALEIRGLRQSARRVPVLGLFETTMHLSHSFGNPFDPDQIEVEATFVSPDGRIQVVPGFYYRGFTRKLGPEGEVLAAKGREEWKVRFTPVEAGEHAFYLTAKTDGEEVKSGRMSFEAVPSDRTGFVRISRSDPSWFELSTGEFFYPIGHNVRSPTDPRCAKAVYGEEEPLDRGTFAYDHYLGKLSACGANFFEVWMSSWWLGLEWTRRWKGYHDIGHYSSENAWKLDHLIGLCERLDLRMHMVIDNHGKASSFVDPEWKHNAYNVANGGFLRSPEEFFTDERAKGCHKKKLRYIVARWGYSPRIMGFELWSEIDLTGSAGRFRRNPSKRQWHREMIRYLRQTDPWRHLCTTHYSGNYHGIDRLMISMREIDYVAVDAYRGGGTVIPLIAGTAQLARGLGKPGLVTEYGGNPWGFKSGDKLARLEADLHAGLWSGLAAGLSGTPLLWWFDFVDREDLYHHFAALARFCEGEDLRGMRLKPMRVEVEAGEEHKDIRAIALASETKAYVWVYQEEAAVVTRKDDAARTVSGFSFPLQMENGEYEILFWDTYKGKALGTSRVKTEEGVLPVKVPAFKRDIACKIRSVGKIAPAPKARERRPHASGEAGPRGAAPYE